MRKLGILLLSVMLLAGCGAPVDYETMSDVYVKEERQAAEILVVLPPDAAVMTASEGSDHIWLCDGYTVVTQTLAGGDLVCRGVILDDGAYHYVLSLQTDAEQAGKLADDWQTIVASFSLDIVP